MKVKRKPHWLAVKLGGGGEFPDVRRVLRKYRLHTVCEEARCPNIGECWGEGTATFMILGDTCTRHCKFCATRTGNPRGLVDEDEPERLRDAVSELGLDYVVITSVTRDDLPDGGASIFARTVRLLKELPSPPRVELLIPDFRGDRAALEEVVGAGPDVVAHNLETVRRLTPIIRDRRASYDVSLEVLRLLKEIKPDLYTKSGLILGMGETRDEIIESLRDMRERGVDFVTMGQYLRPTLKHLPVDRFLTPDEFRELEEIALSMGFLYAASGPLVRSSYRAGEFFVQSLLKGRKG